MKDYFDQIEDFLNGNLQGEKKLLFEQELKNDPKLRAAVDHFPLAQKIAAGLIELDTRETIQRLHKLSHTIKQRFQLVAAVFALVIALGVIFRYFVQNQSDPEKLIAELYFPPVANINRSTTVELNSLDSAVYYFDVKDFDKAFLLLSQQSDSTNSDKVIRYLAHTAFNQKKYTLAESHFQKLSSSPSYRLEAKYNLLLIAVLEGKKKNAEILLLELRNSNYISKEDIKKIEKAMQSQWN